MNISLPAVRAAAMAALFILVPISAHALFEDVDARRSLLDLRKQVNELSSRIDAKLEALQQGVDSKLQPLGARIDSKADTKALLKLSEEIDKLRLEIAALRGQIEVVSNDIVNTQRRQKDFYTDLDQRMRTLDQKQAALDTRQSNAEAKQNSFEARQSTIENKQGSIEFKLANMDQKRADATGSDGLAAPVATDEPMSEQRTYDLALTQFKAQNFRAAAQGFTDFLKRFPDSTNLSQGYFWLGSSYYAMQDCVNAIPAFQTVITRFTNSQRAPDAMLSMAECQSDMKDKTAARQTLNNLIKRFPSSAAAKTGKERLAELK
ncbi:MAG: tol-pal system protein YbgF [Burkholderiaceae bacterium]